MWKGKVTRELKRLYRLYEEKFNCYPDGYLEVNCKNLTYEEFVGYIKESLKYDVSFPCAFYYAESVEKAKNDYKQYGHLNMECPVCSDKMIVDKENDTYTIICTNPFCHAYVDVKDKELEELIKNSPDSNIMTPELEKLYSLYMERFNDYPSRDLYIRMRCNELPWEEFAGYIKECLEYDVPFPTVYFYTKVMETAKNSYKQYGRLNMKCPICNNDVVIEKKDNIYRIKCVRPFCHINIGIKDKELENLIKNSANAID